MLDDRIPRSRLRDLNEAPLRPSGEYVLYWMVAARRARWSFALDRAVAWARELGAKDMASLKVFIGGAPVGERRASRNQRAVVRTLPTSTTNITGLRARCLGASLRRLSIAAVRRIAGSNSERRLVREGLI